MYKCKERRDKAERAQAPPASEQQQQQQQQREWTDDAPATADEVQAKGSAAATVAAPLPRAGYANEPASLAVMLPTPPLKSKGGDGARHAQVGAAA